MELTECEGIRTGVQELEGTLGPSTKSSGQLPHTITEPLNPLHSFAPIFDEIR